VFGGGANGPFVFNATIATASNSDIFSNWPSSALGVALPQGHTAVNQASAAPFPIIGPLGWNLGARILTVGGRLTGIGTVLGLALIQTGGSPRAIQMARASKASGKEKASDVPSWTSDYPKGPGENCAAYAARILAAKYGAGSPQAEKRGPGSEFSKIKKACERGGL
jgi:hypothetical protein